jgi:integrase
MRKRGPSWEVRVYLGRDSVTGKERYATKTVKGGKRDAERCLSEMISEAKNG